MSSALRGTDRRFQPPEQRIRPRSEAHQRPPPDGFASMLSRIAGDKKLDLTTDGFLHGARSWLVNYPGCSWSSTPRLRENLKLARAFRLDDDIAVSVGPKESVGTNHSFHEANRFLSGQAVTIGPDGNHG